jgi:rhodanese-related sulfurtransferase
MFDPHGVPAVTVLDARRLLEEDAGASGPLLVDVREPNEFAEFRAEGAVLFPLSTFMLRYQSLPHDRRLLMICRTGARSGQATAFLRANGWAEVDNVEGGTLAWMRAGLPARQGALEPGEGDYPG